MKSLRFVACAAVVSAMNLPTLTHAQSYKVVVGEIPGTPPLVELMKAFGDLTGVKVDVVTVPMARMVHMVATKQCDVGLPMLATKNTEKIEQLPYDYSTETLSDTAFVLFTNKSKPIDAATLKAGNPKGYQIESDLSSVDLFEFAVLPSTSVEASLKKVNQGRIDGYLMGQLAADPVLKAMKLPNVRRQLYGYVEIVYILQKGGRGGPVDKFLSDGAQKLRESGQWTKVMKGDSGSSGRYVEWQP